MSETNRDTPPRTFGERFREGGLQGLLTKKKKSDSDPNAMHFLEHLEELRWVILKSVLAFLLGCIGIAIFMQDSVKLLQVPLIKAVEDFGRIEIDLQSVGLEDYIKPLEEKDVDLGMLRNADEGDLIEWGIDNPHHRNRLLSHFAGGGGRNLLQVIRSYSPIFIAMKICFLGGIGISLPLILYFVGTFVVPGLTPREKKVFFPGCVAAILLFLAGASMTYFFILPLSLAFTIEFSFNILGLDVYRPEAGNYYSTVIWMTFAVGIAFQFPLVLILLIRIGILSVQSLRQSRRIVLVILMISAALITPGGDPVSLCILTIPLYILYEFAILIGTFVERGKAIRDWEEKDEETRGPRPTGSSVSLWAIVLALALIIISLVIWKFQDLKEWSIIWLDLGEQQEDTSKVDHPKDSPTETNATSKVIPNSPFALPYNQEFTIELIPFSEGNITIDQNHTLMPSGLYRALLRKSK